MICMTVGLLCELYLYMMHICVFPDLVSDMLGSDKYKLSWQTALDSLQDPYINR